MKTLKKLFLLILVLALFAISIHAQKHTHPEYEKELQYLKDNQIKAEETYQQAKETYALSKEVFEKKKSIDDDVYKWLGTFISILFLVGAGSQASNWFTNRKLISENKVANDKIIKDANDKLIEFKETQLITQSKEIKKIIKANEETIIKMIASKEKDYLLRKSSKIIVINHNKTVVGLSFKKVLGLFNLFNFENDMMNLEKLSDVLKIENINKLKNSDLVIIENLASEGQWIIGFPRNPEDENIKSLISNVDNSTLENISDSHNQALLINLANKICDTTAMIYYGPGILLSNLVDEDKQHIVSFANSPSTLYSNIMNMLKFQDVLKEEA